MQNDEKEKPPATIELGPEESEKGLVFAKSPQKRIFLRTHLADKACGTNVDIGSTRVATSAAGRGNWSGQYRQTTALHVRLKLLGHLLGSCKVDRATPSVPKRRAVSGPRTKDSRA